MTPAQLDELAAYEHNDLKADVAALVYERQSYLANVQFASSDTLRSEMLRHWAGVTPVVPAVVVASP